MYVYMCMCMYVCMYVYICIYMYILQSYLLICRWYSILIEKNKKYKKTPKKPRLARSFYVPNPQPATHGLPMWLFHVKLNV